MSTSNPKINKRKRWLKMTALIVLAVVALWVVGDFTYSRITHSRIAEWEQTVERRFDGVQLKHQGFECGEGDTAILMVHGINDSPNAFVKMAPRFADQGYFCRAMRLPNFAKTLPEYSRSDSEQWIARVHENILELQESHERVFVLAHSLGGATTIQVQLRHQPEIDGLILLAPAIEVSNVRSPVFSTRFWHEFGKRVLLFTTIVENPFTVDAHDPAEANRADRNRFSPIRVIDETFRLIDANRGRAKEIDVPVLMVLTRDDRVINYRSCEQFFEQLGSERKEIYYNDESGHALPYDYGWEKVVNRTVDFLNTFETPEQVARNE